MPTPARCRLSQQMLARRALLEPARSPSRWWRVGCSVLAVSVLGVTGSVARTGAAESPVHATRPTAETIAKAAAPTPGAASVARSHSARPSRSHARPTLDPAAVIARTDRRGRSLARTRDGVVDQARVLSRAQRKQRRAGTPRLPLPSGYTTAARFGQVGVWARYHTGFDFAAPVGTSVRSPDAGVVTTAGSGAGSDWAGTYVTIRHGDKTTSLYAHLSSVRVAAGDRVRAGQEIGAVGLTGRTFGPHLHFEIYPAGVKPTDILRAIDPEPWLRSRGLRP